MIILPDVGLMAVTVGELLKLHSNEQSPSQIVGIPLTYTITYTMIIIEVVLIQIVGKPLTYTITYSKTIIYYKIM